MRSLARPTCTALLAAAVSLMPRVAWAQELKGRPLPAFSVTATDGSQVASASLNTEERWILFYLSPQSPPSHRLLRFLGEWQIPQLPSRAVLVIRGDVQSGHEYLAQRAPDAIREQLHWYADTQNAAWDALGLQGTPMLMGVQNGEVAWVLAGVLSKPEMLESVVRTWVEGK